MQRSFIKPIIALVVLGAAVFYVPVVDGSAVGLSATEQLVVGGACDCEYNGTVDCYSATTCVNDGQCTAGTRTCADTTREETCQNTWMDLWWCYETGPHQCNPLKAEIADCGWGYCKHGGAGLGNCVGSKVRTCDENDD